MTLSPTEEGEQPPLAESRGAATAAGERKQQEPPLTSPKKPSPPPSAPSPFLLPPAALFPSSALKARDEGNAAMRSGDFDAAVVCYSRALLSLLESEKEEKEEGQGEGEGEEGAAAENSCRRRRHCRLARALVLSNRAAARLSLGRFSKAAADALEAIELCPLWWRPWARLARARAGAGDARGGVRACRDGSEAVAAAAAASTSASASEAKSVFPTRERLEAQAALRLEADEIALAAAHEGRFDGFDGAVLEVRPAESGSEWLGLPAPAREDDSSEDDDDDEEGASARRRICCSNGDDGGGAGSGGGGNALAALSSSSSSSPPRAEKSNKKRTSFRSLHDALAAAEDGDVILLLSGTHNGLGRSAVVDKRVLIDGRRREGGEGGKSLLAPPPFAFSAAGAAPAAAAAASAAAAATLDARGNVPALRFRRPAAVVGVSIDATGFREAVRVDSLLPSSSSFAAGSGGDDKRGRRRRCCSALLAGCSLASSGDDACVAAGRLASLTMLDCAVVGAGRAGVRSFAGAAVELRRCSVGRCGTHGFAAVALSPSSPFLPSSCSPSLSSNLVVLGGTISARQCRVSHCREEGALCAGRGSRLVLEGTEIENCRGPAVDASGGGCSVLVRGSGTRLSECSGGLWLWRGARARVRAEGNNSISGGATFAVLTDGEGTRLEIEKGCCEVLGGVKGAEAERAVAASARGGDAAGDSSSDRENGDGDGDGGGGGGKAATAASAKLQQRRQQRRRHCGPPPEVGPFRWDGPDPLRAE